MSKLFNKTLSEKNFNNSVTAPKFYRKSQEFPNYEEWIGSEEGKSLLNQLKGENKTLKEEMEKLSNYLRNVAKIFQVLESENTNLKGQLQRREVDLQRVMESIATNQNQNEVELTHQIQLFEEEHKLLTQHLQSCMSKLEIYNSKLEEKNQQIQRAKEYNSQIESNMNLSLQREKDLTNEVSMKSLKVEEAEKEVTTLQGKIKPLEDLIKSLQTDNYIITQEMESIKSNYSKKDIEDKNRLTQLNQQFYASKTDQQHYQHLCIQQDQQIKELKQQLQHFTNQDLSSQVAIQQHEIQNLMKELELERKKVQHSQQRESQMSHQLNTLQLQYQELQTQYDALMKEMRKKVAELEYENTQLQSKSQRHLEKIKAQYLNQLREKDDEIKQLENIIAQLRMEHDEAQRDIQQKSREIQHLKQQIIELESFKRQFNEFRLISNQKDAELKAQQQQFNGVQHLLKKTNEDLEERLINSQEQIRVEQEKNDKLYEQLEQLKWYQEQYDDIQNKQQDNKIDKDNMKIEISSYQSKINQLENQKEECMLNQRDLEGQLNDLQILNKQLNRQLSDLENLKVENKILREFQSNRKGSGSTKYEQDNEGSGQKQQTLPSTRVFQVQSPAPAPKPKTSQQALLSPPECRICDLGSKSSYLKPIVRNHPYHK